MVAGSRNGVFPVKERPPRGEQRPGRFDCLWATKGCASKLPGILATALC